MQQFRNLSVEEKEALLDFSSGCVRKLEHGNSGRYYYVDEKRFVHGLQTRMALVGMFERWRSAFRSIARHEYDKDLSGQDLNARCMCVQELCLLATDDEFLGARAMVLQIVTEFVDVPCTVDGLFAYWQTCATRMEWFSLQQLCKAVQIQDGEGFVARSVYENTSTWNDWSNLFLDADGNFDPLYLTLLILMQESNSLLPVQNKLEDLAHAWCVIRQVLSQC